MKDKSLFTFTLSYLLLFPLVSFAQEKNPPPNLYAEQFYMDSGERLRHKVSEVRGFLFVETPNRERNTRYSVVTDFDGRAVKTRFVPGMSDLSAARKWIDASLRSAKFQEVEIRELTIPLNEKESKKLYWVGQKAFESVDQAKAQIAMVETLARAQKANFKNWVAQVNQATRVAEEEAPVEIKSPSDQQREEEIVLKYLDQLDIGNKMFGPIHGEGTGESVTWQSFGETTWRDTNLDKKNFNDQVGFWTNRLVFKGIRAPFSSIDLYGEATTALESHGKDFASHMDLFGGVEWRPLSRNPRLYNFRPWSIPLLEWVRNYRFYFQYGDRKNLKDEIDASRDYETIYGVQNYYEGGIDLPSISEGEPSSFGDYVRHFGWWEYFGNYRFERTNFSSQDDFNAFILNSSIHLGLKLPGIPLPFGPYLDEFVLMPYLRFEHINNTEFSLPFQNQYFVAAGARWMPFRNYHFSENEWLSKTKIFAEYVGIGDVQNAKQDGEAPDAITHDLRFGVSFSQRRF